MKRNEFIKKISFASLLMADGKILPAFTENIIQKNSQMRFLVASDGHFGQAKTDFVNYYETFVSQANQQHLHSKLDFCVINGDIIHDDPQFMPQAKQILDKLRNCLS